MKCAVCQTTEAPRFYRHDVSERDDLVTCNSPECKRLMTQRMELEARNMAALWRCDSAGPRGDW